MDRIKLGTIGSGEIVKIILNNVKRVEGIELHAVYSRKEETAKELCEEYGGKRIYTNMEEFLADSEMNFVYIASPNLLHYRQTKDALLAGKNVICEKPFVTKASQAEELIDLAKERGLFLIDATPTAFLPNLRIIRDNIAKIGKIKLVMGNYSQYSSRYETLLSGGLPNVFNPEFAGGCLMDLNYYNLYLIVKLFGEPKSYIYYPNLYDGKIDTSGNLILQYEGFVGTAMGAKDTFGVNFFQIEGENGYIYVDRGPNGLVNVRVATKDSDETYNNQDDPDRWYYEVEGIKDMVFSGDHKTNDSNLEVTRCVMRILEGARKNVGIVFPGDVN